MQYRFIAFWVALAFLVGGFGVAQAGQENGYPTFEPWGQVYSQFSYNISGYEDYDERYDDNDANAFDLTRVWFGLDSQMSKHWRARIVLAGSRSKLEQEETAEVPSGKEDDPSTPDVDESVQEVVTGFGSAGKGAFDVYVTYAFFTYKPFDALGFDMGMIPNAYNTKIYDYWRYNYIITAALYVHKMTRSSFGDVGAAVHGNFPKGYGGYRVALLNGEGKKAEEANAGKAGEVQVHLYPFRSINALSNLSLMGFVRYDKQEPDYPEMSHLIYDALLSYQLEVADGMGFSLNGEYIQRTTTFGDDTDAINSVVFSGWADFWFLRNYGLLGRYDYFDPNTENDEDSGVGYEDETGHLLAGVFYNPIKQVKLCLNYRMDTYSEKILDDNGDETDKQPDQYVVFNTEFKFK